jgi:hypothetical protein
MVCFLFITDIHKGKDNIKILSFNNISNIIIKMAKNTIELELAKGKQIKESVDTVLKDLFQI